jgi:hypothetical protein
MASLNIAAANLANYIPAILSKAVQSAAESLLVTGKLVDRSFESMAKAGGSTIKVPLLANITANAVSNRQADATLYDTMQNSITIALDQVYDIGVAIDDITALQTNPKYFDKVRDKLAYGLAKAVDTIVNTEFVNFSQTVGTEGSALTEDVILQAYEYLNIADAPAGDRAWVFDPESITDLMKIDMFVKMDYVGDAVWKTGFSGRQILGSPVYWSTNLAANNTNYHCAAYLHKEALALVVQMPSTFETFRLPLKHSDGILGLTVFGVKEMRDTFGVYIKTRS